MSRSITEVAMAALARREHSIEEMRRKLRLKGFESAEIDVVIEKLLHNNCLSDERFTETYINMRRQRGYGPLRIAQELRERGVDNDLSDALLDKNDPRWRDIMRRQYQKKFAGKPALAYGEKVRRARYLQSRGFPLDWVFKLDSMDIDDY